VSAEQQPTDKLIGQILGNRYQILHQLGEGAMGAVYKARHVRVGRPFAVKVLHPRLLSDTKVALRFDREAELAGRLRHANVVGVVDIGDLDGTRYMVMDFAEGPDLAQLLVEAPMPPERIVHLVRQMLEGLYHAHERGLIHRDFKPENVIIERDTHGAEMPRIVDFGIAILRDAGEGTEEQGRLTTNGLVLGTPHYMAPEQAVADPIDHRIDLFALGIVVYEMLSGRLPFDGSGAEVARANLLLDPPPIVQRVPYLEVDPLLEAFARRLMAKKRTDRPATAKAARELLDLIERDRAAAAAALGMPVSDRAPAATLPVEPQGPASPAPAAIDPNARMKPAPQPGQPVVPVEPLGSGPSSVPGAVSVASSAPVAAVFSAPRALAVPPPRPTTIRTPLSWEAASFSKSRLPWLILSAVLGAGVVAAALMLMSAGEPDAPPPGDRVAMTASGADSTSAPATDPTPTPAAVQPISVPIEPAAVALPPVDHTVEPAPVDRAAVDLAPAPAPARAAAPRRPEVDGRPRPPRNVETAVSGGRTPATSDRQTDGRTEPRRAADSRPADVGTTGPSSGAAAGNDPPASVREIKPQAMAGISPGAIAKLYYSIRPQLDQLPAADSADLRERLRLYDVQELMIGSQARRDEVATQLMQILNEAVARKARSGAPHGDKRSR
jgi:serine/threonine protein kinase